jgi:hypothetical protein
MNHSNIPERQTANPLTVSFFFLFHFSAPIWCSFSIPIRNVIRMTRQYQDFFFLTDTNRTFYLSSTPLFPFDRRLKLQGKRAWGLFSFL